MAGLKPPEKLQGNEYVTLLPGDLYWWHNRGWGWVAYLSLGWSGDGDPACLWWNRGEAARVDTTPDAQSPGWVSFCTEGARPGWEW